MRYFSVLALRNATRFGRICSESCTSLFESSTLKGNIFFRAHCRQRFFGASANYIAFFLQAVQASFPAHRSQSHILTFNFSRSHFSLSYTSRGNRSFGQGGRITEFAMNAKTFLSSTKQIMSELAVQPVVRVVAAQPAELWATRRRGCAARSGSELCTQPCRSYRGCGSACARFWS